MTKVRRHCKAAYRSGLENRIAEQLKSSGLEGNYEQYKIRFTQPAKKRTYTPDFWLISKTGKEMIIESKGLFTVPDRQKHLMIKAEHPTLDIRFVFSNPNTKLYKKRKLTYAQWCEKHGFKYAKNLIPSEWIKELEEC